MNKVDFRVEELMNLHTFSIGKIVEMLKNEGFEKQEIDDAINNFIRNHIEPIVEYDLQNTIKQCSYLISNTKGIKEVVPGLQRFAVNCKALFLCHFERRITLEEVSKSFHDRVKPVDNGGRSCIMKLQVNLFDKTDPLYLDSFSIEEEYGFEDICEMLGVEYNRWEKN